MRTWSSCAVASLSLTFAGCTNLLLPSSALSVAPASNYARPVAAPSECFINVVVPAVVETLSERVLIRAATTRTEITPARYEPVTESVLVKPASIRFEVIPATFETVTERELIKPARKQTEVVPPTFETVTERWVVRPEIRRVEEVAEVLATEVERVLLTSATTLTKLCSELSIAERAALVAAADAKDGRCQVAVPAEYRDVTRSVVKTPATAREIVTPAQYKVVLKEVQVAPASTREIELPAEYADVAKVVVKTPATTREIEVPAQYQTVVTQRLVTPSVTRTVVTPAEYEMVSRTLVKTPATIMQRQVVCGSRFTPAWLGTVQAALSRAGFNTGRADGIVDNATVDALRGFQRARNLPVDEADYLNVATVRALGLSER